MVDRDGFGQCYTLRFGFRSWNRPKSAAGYCSLTMSIRHLHLRTLFSEAL